MDNNEEQLTWQLRSLCRDQEPANDLWPGIATRMLRQAQSLPRTRSGDERLPMSAFVANVVPLRPRGAARFVPWALAASLVLAVGVVWQQRPQRSSMPPAEVASDPSARLIRREAEAMTREYSAALRELHVPGAFPATQSSEALRQLDLSARQIRSALARDPDARFLLDRLRSTYDKRLQLTQRAVLG